MYIVIEGQDATGKDTQALKLAEFLRKRGGKVTLYAESGTGSEDEFVQKIAELTYRQKYDLAADTRVLLYLVNRYEQWRKLAEPALANNEMVITTRNWLSTLIYEGYGGGADLALIEKLHRAVMPERYFRPDKIVILTLSDAERKKRLMAQGRERWEVFKSQNDQFQKILNQAYLKEAKRRSIPCLSAVGTVEEVFEKLRQLLFFEEQ